MTVRVITPALPVVDLEDAKDFLRVDSDDHDAMIEGLIMAAQSEIDGPNGWLGRAIGEQTLEAAFCDFGNPIRLPYPDVISVEGVHYVDRDGAEQTVPDTSYEVVGREIRLLHGFYWPAARYQSDAVRIRYIAGMEDESPDLERVRLAIKVHVQGHYDGEAAPNFRQIFDGLVSSLQVYA